MLYNYKFGHLTGQHIDYAPLNQKIGEWWYCPASDQQQRECGWYDIKDNPQPLDGHRYTSRWQQIDNVIVKVWDMIPDPEPIIPTPAEKREEAYRTVQIIEWPIQSFENSNGDFELLEGSANGLITVDEGVKLVTEYSCETTQRAAVFVAYLKERITYAKQVIREMYPDPKNELNELGEESIPEDEVLEESIPEEEPTVEEEPIEEIQPEEIEEE